MFEVKVEGVDQLVAKLDKYQAQLTELQTGMPEEMDAWQREDMKRRYPSTDSNTVDTHTTASTTIKPRSAIPTKNSIRRQGPKQHRPATKRGPLPPSTRPILRTELLRQLWTRMARLTAEALRWP